MKGKGKGSPGLHQIFHLEYRVNGDGFKKKHCKHAKIIKCVFNLLI